MKTVKQILKPENGIEEAIVAHPDFVEGCNYGKPRSGHPEGKVIYHIKEVLINIDEWYFEDKDREALRLIALVVLIIMERLQGSLHRSSHKTI